jgi:TolB-like protein
MCLYLLEHRDRVVSREELCNQVWPGQIVSQATLEGVIRLVRKAVGDDGRTQSVIQTLHGHGYRFIAPVDERLQAEPDGKAPETVALPRTVGIPVLHDDVGGPSEYLEKEDQEASLAAAIPEVSERSPFAINGESKGRRAVMVMHEQWSMVTRAGWRWWLPRLGLALALIALGVLVGWAASGEIRVHAKERLDKSRVAILPFIDLSPEADQSSIADGLTENLIADLARVQGLTVIARSSVLKYKGSLKDVATIGKELRVGTIVQGSVRRTDNQVRISAQLIDVASQGHLWSHEYDRDRTQVSGVENEITIRIAQWLKGQSTADQINDCLRAQPQPTTLVQTVWGSQ